MVGKGFAGIYSNDENTLKDARQALQLKREILLANPELDMDKLIVAVTISVPLPARSIPVRWEHRIITGRTRLPPRVADSMRRSSNYRIFAATFSHVPSSKPDNGSSVPDLKLHWDADRVMFSMIDTDKRWQVFEVGLDGKV